MEFENKMTSVYPIKAKIIGHGSSKSIKTLNRRLHWGQEGIVYQHDPRHVDVLVEDFGLEHGNSVQTPAAPDQVFTHAFPFLRVSFVVKTSCGRLRVLHTLVPQSGGESDASVHT